VTSAAAKTDTLRSNCTHNTKEQCIDIFAETKTQNPDLHGMPRPPIHSQVCESCGSVHISPPSKYILNTRLKSQESMEQKQETISALRLQ
jgi:hypothetical protein